MQFPDAQTLANVNQSTLFLWMAWDEMFDPLTPDSFQPRISNTFSLMQEIAEVAHQCEESARWAAHLAVLQEELKTVRKEEEDLLANLPLFGSLVDKYCSAKSGEIVPLIPTVQVFELQFLNLVLLSFTNSIAGLPKEKEHCLRALQRCATIALKAGFSAKELRSLCDLDSLKMMPEQFAQRIVDAVTIAQSEMSIWFAVEGDPSDIQAILRPVDIIGGVSKKFQEPEVIKFLNEISAFISPTQTFTIAYCKQVGLSQRHATNLALKRIRQALDIHNFYSSRIAVNLLPLVLAKHANGQFEQIDLNARDLRQIRVRKETDARNLTLQALHSIPSEELGDKCLNALEHYSLGGSSSIVRVRLVNLWTAIECLSGSSDSVIERVCGVVTPIVVWRRSDRILSYIAKSITDSLKSTGLKAFGFSKNGYVIREKLLLSLAKGTGDPTNIELAELTKSHPLLAYRLFLAAKDFSCPRALGRSLKESQQRVRWHLFRIYRSRNLIVHHGKDVDCIEALADNLYNYASITISRVLHRMVDVKNVSVGEAIAYWQLRTDHLLCALLKDPGRLEIADFFARPRDNYKGQRIWNKEAPV